MNDLKHTLSNVYSSVRVGVEHKDEVEELEAASKGNCVVNGAEAAPGIEDSLAATKDIFSPFIKIMYCSALLLESSLSVD